MIIDDYRVIRTCIMRVEQIIGMDSDSEEHTAYSGIRSMPLGLHHDMRNSVYQTSLLKRRLRLTPIITCH
jgi:hypothetical protein